MKKTFKLSPMSGFIAVLTLIVLCVPVVLFIVGLWRVGLAVLLVYAAVWLFMRPRAFEVGEHGVDLVFPLRRTRVARAEIASVGVMSKDQFKERFGTALRIGAGGLWGGFGWLWTSNEGLIDFFISRQDDFVLIERRNGKPLLITPVRPHEFVRELA